MAIFALTNAKVLVGTADLSAWSTEVSIEPGNVALDATTFASGGARTYIGGLRDGKFDLKGFYEANNVSGILPNEVLDGVGTGGVVTSVYPQGATDTNAAFFGTFLNTTYSPNGKVGDIFSFSNSGQADAPIIGGQVANSTARTSTGTGTALNLGAVGASQRVWAALHVLTVAGTGTPTLTVSVQSDTSNAFPSPTTVATFTAATAATSQVVKGAIGVNADTWYRFSWTISGTTPSFTFFGAVGIL